MHRKIAQEPDVGRVIDPCIAAARQAQRARAARAASENEVRARETARKLGVALRDLAAIVDLRGPVNAARLHVVVSSPEFWELPRRRGRGRPASDLAFAAVVRIAALFSADALRAADVRRAVYRLARIAVGVDAFRGKPPNAARYVKDCLRRRSERRAEDSWIDFHAFAVAIEIDAELSPEDRSKSAGFEKLVGAPDLLRARLARLGAR